MKTKNKKRIEETIKILLLSVFFIFPIGMMAENQSIKSPDLITERVNKLSKDLQLSDTQINDLEEILNQAEKNAAEDRKTYKANPISLIEAAYKRRGLTNQKIETLLNPHQKEEFKKITKMSAFDGELFELIHGLVLNDDQAFTVEGILIEYYNTLKEYFPEEMLEHMSEGRKGTMGMGRYRYSKIKGIMKEIEKKKVRKIKKILTDEQLDSYILLRKHKKK